MKRTFSNRIELTKHETRLHRCIAIKGKQARFVIQELFQKLLRMYILTKQSSIDSKLHLSLSGHLSILRFMAFVYHTMVTRQAYSCHSSLSWVKSSFKHKMILYLDYFGHLNIIRCKHLHSWFKSLRSHYLSLIWSFKHNTIPNIRLLHRSHYSNLNNPLKHNMIQFEVSF